MKNIFKSILNLFSMKSKIQLEIERDKKLGRGIYAPSGSPSPKLNTGGVFGKSWSK